MPPAVQVHGSSAVPAARNAATAPSPSTSSTPGASAPAWKTCAPKIQILPPTSNAAQAIWLYEHGPTFPGDPQTGRLGETEADQARFEEFANEAPCPALNPATGLCDIYEWRPMTCRVFGPPVRMEPMAAVSSALGHCELCFGGATTAQIAACEMPVPHDLEQELLDRIPVHGETIVAFALLR